MYDLIIVGGGPAGMSAALYAARQNLRFIVIAKETGGLANLVPSLKTYLGFYYITGFELVEKFMDHLKRYKVRIKNDEVFRIEKRDGAFVVSAREKKYMSRSVIVATGRRFKKIGIPGEEKYSGKGLSDCTVCDGPLFRNKTVAVIGGGRTGLFAVMFLLKIAKKIYLIEKNSHIKTEGGLKRFADVIRKNRKVKVLTGTEPLEVKGGAFVKELQLSGKGKKQGLPVEGVFVEIGYEPNTEFMPAAVKTNSRKEIIVDAECVTSMPGMFAAGDVTSLREKQVLVSVGEGAKAALSAVLYLEKSAK